MESLLPSSSPLFILPVAKNCPRHINTRSFPPSPITFPTPRHHLRSSSPSRRRRLRSSSPSSSPSITSAEDANENVTVNASEEKFGWHAKWYPVLPICDLDKRAPCGLTILGLDVVVWWDRAADSWWVVDDRCPHCLAPLSEGWIDRWGRLQCMYHGWCFDGSRGCQFVPQALPEGPPVHTFKKACAAVYPSVVQNKILWFWPDTDPKNRDILEKEKPPYIPELDDASYSCVLGTRDYLLGYDYLLENFMDPAHVPYAHYKLMDTPKHPGSSPPDREGGAPIEISVESFNINGFISPGYCKFIAPCTYYVYFDVDAFREGAVYSSDTQGNSAAEVQRSRRRKLYIFYCIPVGPGKSRLIWAFQKNFGVWMDNLLPRWVDHLKENLVYDSDLCLLHLEERKIAEVGINNWHKACFMPTKSDAQVIAFRKWFRKYSDNRVDFGAKFTGLLPHTPPREQLLDRYWTHVVNCPSCRGLLKGLRVLKIVLQAVPIASIGILAAAKDKIVSTAARTAIVSMSLACFIASKWLAHFIYKNFYFHDYDHAAV